MYNQPGPSCEWKLMKGNDSELSVVGKNGSQKNGVSHMHLLIGLLQPVTQILTTLTEPVSSSAWSLGYMQTTHCVANIEMVLKI